MVYWNRQPLAASSTVSSVANCAASSWKALLLLSTLASPTGRSGSCTAAQHVRSACKTTGCLSKLDSTSVTACSECLASPAHRRPAAASRRSSCRCGTRQQPGTWHSCTVAAPANNPKTLCTGANGSKYSVAHVVAVQCMHFSKRHLDAGSRRKGVLDAGCQAGRCLRSNAQRVHRLHMYVRHDPGHICSGL